MSSSRHPLLGLTPVARRQLAHTLLDGLDVFRSEDKAAKTRKGLLSGAACGAVGGGLWLGWNHLTGGDAASFTLWYGLWLGVQAGVGRTLERARMEIASPPLRAAILAPAKVADALGAWLVPQRITPDRLVLAAGILVAVRRPVSYHLLRRLYARAYPAVEVDRAIELLEHLGYLQMLPAEAPGALVLTREGFAVLQELGVEDPAPRPRQDPQVAPHLVPLFATLEKPWLRHASHREEPAAAVELPQIVRPVHEEPPPAEAEPRWTPQPSGELPWEEPEGEAAPAAERAPFRLPHLALPQLRHKTTAIAASVLLAGILVFVSRPWWPQPQARHTLLATASLMPHSQGTALQFNGRGLMLSSYDGGLFLSVPDRLDYKRPLTFKGYDMASSCGLVDRPLSQVSMSPHGRFIWTEMGGAGKGPLERCLVDMETKTVTHDLVKRNPIYGLPGMVGWADDTRLIMEEELPPRQAERWWLVNVTNHHETAVTLPRHARLMPLPVDTGGILLLGLDMRQLGAWDLTTYWLDDQGTYQKLRTVRATFPEHLKEAEPLHAAISPDKRYLLLALRQVQSTDKAGTLAVVSLEDGSTTPLEGAPNALPDAPIFWGPEVQGGRYRFYFNASTPDGVSPWSGEVQLAGS